MKKYVAIFTFSTRTGTDTVSTVRTVLECTEATTIAQIAAWQKAKDVWTPISLTIEEVEGEKP